MFESDNGVGIRDMLIPAVKGFITGIIVSAVLLFVLAGIAFFSDDPDMLVPILGVCALYICAAVMGGVSARMYGRVGYGGVICAAVAGAMMLVLIFIMSALPAESTGDMSSLTRVIMYAAVPAVSSLAGALFMPRRHKPRHRRRR